MAGSTCLAPEITTGARESAPRSPLWLRLLSTVSPQSCWETEGALKLGCALVTLSLCLWIKAPFAHGGKNLLYIPL